MGRASALGRGGGGYERPPEVPQGGTSGQLHVGAPQAVVAARDAHPHPLAVEPGTGYSPPSLHGDDLIPRIEGVAHATPDTHHRQPLLAEL